MTNALPITKAEKAVLIRAAMSLLGSATSQKKRDAARRNAKKGGRPRKAPRQK